MTMKFPDLAVRTYEDILDEMVSSIPRYSEKWINFNPADPGITILEILAWIFDANLYMINRMPEESYMNFIRLIAGARGEDVNLLLDKLRKDPNSDRDHIELLSFLKEIEEKKNNGHPIKDINGMKAAALRFLQSDYRAVTEENFAALAIEATRNRDEKIPGVKRTIVKGSPDGKIEIIIISDRQEKYAELKKIVKDYLEPRRLICTKIVVKEPVYSLLKIQIEATLLPHASARIIKRNIQKNIEDFLDPVKGGDDKKGWPYGRPVSVYELFHIIEETQGVDHVDNVILDDKPGLKNKKIEGLMGKVDISIKVAGEK
ncbi:MAG: hypothetical protein C3F06_11765 [Candidatus Methanoperedenaceae archaeon]|nr:MAG: hypothetical protein C3F06_11765 [Candidatus Methanoperedenaceae archaeon]